MNSLKLANLLIRNSKKDTFKISDFISVITKNKLEYLLPSIKIKLAKIQREQDFRNEIKIQTPHPVSKEIKEKIENVYNLKIEKEEIEKEMIAGYKLYSKDKIVDASLNTLLKKFTK
jgi:F0F1-type ATP synthase delta subunit